MKKSMKELRMKLNKKERLRKVLNAILYDEIGDVCDREYPNIKIVADHYRVDEYYNDIDTNKFKLLAEALIDYLELEE